jgi:hypothetical protein
LRTHGLQGSKRARHSLSAYAEAGRFDKAVETAKRTSELALATGRKDLADTAKARLRLYQAGKPYHEVATNVSQ